MAYIRNVRPGFTILVACCNNPTRDKISRLVAFFLVSHDDTKVTMRLSLSAGKHASMLWVSNVIPKKGSDSDGPSTFSKARGIPSCAHTSLITSKFLWQIDDCGGPMRRKSSS